MKPITAITTYYVKVYIPVVNTWVTHYERATEEGARHDAEFLHRRLHDKTGYSFKIAITKHTEEEI